MAERDYAERPLTKEEQAFAEENHELMYKYMKAYKLDLEEWYDVLIIGQCKEESLDKGREKKVLSFWKIFLLSNPNNDRGRSTCAWNAESSCGIVDRHTKRNTFITGEQ